MIWYLNRNNFAMLCTLVCVPVSHVPHCNTRKLIRIYINMIFRDTTKRNNERVERNMSNEEKGHVTSVILLVSCRTKGCGNVGNR